MRKIILFLVIVVLLVLGTFAIISGNKIVKENPTPVACTMEAKLCPDGSAVGRSGPKCEFAQCPVATTTLPQNPNPITPYGSAVLRVGGIVNFSDTSILLVKVTDDSRCAEGVTCIWAGTLKADFYIVAGSAKITETIELGKSVTVGNVTISLLSATPYPTAGVAISPGDYRLTIKVVKKVVVTTPPAQGKCYIGGCSGEVCSDRSDMASTCIYRAEYACYRNATCERQTDGKCGWRSTEELKACLANPPTV